MSEDRINTEVNVKEGGYHTNGMSMLSAECVLEKKDKSEKLSNEQIFTLLYTLFLFWVCMWWLL